MRMGIDAHGSSLPRSSTIRSRTSIISPIGGFTPGLAFTSRPVPSAVVCHGCGPVRTVGAACVGDCRIRTVPCSPGLHLVASIIVGVPFIFMMW